MRLPKTFFILLLVICTTLRAQDKKIYASVFISDITGIKPRAAFKDQKDLDTYLSTLITKLQQSGRLEASIDSFKIDSTSQRYYIHAGPEYKWGILRPGNVDNRFLAKAGYKDLSQPFIKLDPYSFTKFRDKIITLYENEGFPFASLQIDSLDQTGDTLSGVLHLTKNQHVIIDSIRVRGTTKISETYLFNYIGVKPGDVYNENVISKIDARLKEISFINVTKPTEVIFTPKYTKILIYAEKKKANQFDGLLGFLPDQEGNLLVTGQVHMNLTNALNNGDVIEINWKKLQPLTQDLYARLNYPFLFRSPFGTDIQLNIYKKDTSYLDVRKYAALQYFLKRGNTFRVFAQNKTTSLLSVKGLETITTLPQFVDVTNVLYGVGYRAVYLDYRYNPRKGYTISFEGGAGSRNIKKNNRINPEAYNNVKLKTSQYQLSGTAELFLPFRKASTLKLGAAGSLLRSESYFVNDLYRIGGLRSLRGFDEESIYASSYAILSTEYRLLIDRNSYIQLFYDQAYYEDLQKRINDTPFGFGAGISFETKAGIFSLSYALGKQFDNPLYLRAAKVHFGIVNYF
jgi:outer membrane protein assembly factor BamA